MFVHKNISVLAWFNFFQGFSLLAPVAAIYFSQTTNSYALGLSIFSIVMVSSAFFEIPTGIFSDRIGRKKTLVLGTLAGIISIVLYAIGTHYWILVLGSLFSGLGLSLHSGNNNALLYDTLVESGNESDYSKALGQTRSTEQIALATSALLGGLVATWSFEWVLWLSVIPKIVCLVLGLTLTEPKIHSQKSGNAYSHLKEALAHFRTNKKLRLLTYADTLDYGIGYAAYQFLPTFINTIWPVWAVGIFRMVSNILAAVSYWFSGQAIDKFTGLKLLLLSKVYSRVIGLLALLKVTVFSPVLIATTSIFHGVERVASDTLHQSEFTHEQRATMGSLITLLGSLFFGIFAIFLGFIADKIGTTNSLILTEILKVVILFLFWILFRRHHAKPAQSGD